MVQPGLLVQRVLLVQQVPVQLVLPVRLASPAQRVTAQLVLPGLRALSARLALVLRAQQVQPDLLGSVLPGLLASLE